MTMKRSCFTNMSRRIRAIYTILMKKKKKVEINTRHTEAMKPLPYLPQHLQLQILSKLPAKSLVRFKCVSKSWRSLISEPYFIKTHLNHSLTKPLGILVASARTNQHTFRLSTISYGPAGYELAPANMNLLFQKQPHQKCEIVGSCNGLICMVVDMQIYIFNLSTREAKLIPENCYFSCDFPSCTGGGPCYITCALGFGYDHCSDDYKLVTITGKSIHVYSLRTDSWKQLENLSNLYFWFSAKGTELNGTLYWLCVDSYSGMPLDIAAFCLADEKVWRIPLPPIFFTKTPLLGVLEGCLSIDDCEKTFWIMNGYGVEVKPSWTKLDFNFPFLYYMEILGSPRKGETILLVDNSKLVSYKARERTYREKTYRKNFSWRRTACATTYVESLVSPL